MDHQFSGTQNVANGFQFDNGDLLLSYEQSQNLINAEVDDLDIPFFPVSPGLDNVAPFPTVSYEWGSPDDQDSDTVLNFISQIINEENMEEKPSMFHDPLALRATEKSLYEVIGQKYPPSPFHLGNNGDQNSPDSLFGSSSEYTNSSNAGSSSINPQWIVDPGEFNLLMEHGHVQDFTSSSLPSSSQLSLDAVNGSYINGNTQMYHIEDTNLLQNIFNDSESMLQYKRGMEEASKFLPPTSQLIIDLDKYDLPKKSEHIIPAVAFKVEKYETDDSPNGLKGRKHQYPEDGDYEDMERSSKQSAVYVEDVELSEMFDRVLLCTDVKGDVSCDDNGRLPLELENTSLPLPDGSNGRRARAQRNENTGDLVDLRSLLISCAQSVTFDDRKPAFEQLKQIMQHSSPTGDVDQRLAHVFASGLQARLAGTGTELYASFTRRNITATEQIKAYQVYISACPFKKSSIGLSNKMIGLVAAKASTLHIVDFGILYGFQWPILIQHLSHRTGGPPKLRITGIELPQPGFRPAERLLETGSRLAKYCERFGVPFEYQAIAAQNWEEIKIEDLKIAKGEVIAVNCLFRSAMLLDETAVENSRPSPRDTVLSLIRRMEPDIFVHTVTNGSFSAPFFGTRFREALFFYSALFDMFDATLPRDNLQRMNFEQNFYGREVINVIACEGVDRVVRPETYKLWHVRHLRAGFKPVPIRNEVMKKIRHKGAGYHKDFLFDQDGSWMLQGWKGRIICASSCWVPS